jgi:hypothetical protein
MRSTEVDMSTAGLTVSVTMAGPAPLCDVPIMENMFARLLSFHLDADQAWPNL